MKPGWGAPASRAERVYRRVAGWLPGGAPEDLDDMARTYGELVREAPTGPRRAWMAGRGLTALAGVLALEWLEHAGLRRAPGRTNGKGRWGMGVGRNVSYAARTLVKAPVFAITSLLLVAVGVGAVTTIFTLVDHVLLRPLPYPAADRLIALENGAFQGPYFRQLETLESVEAWGGAWTDEVNLVGEGEPLRIEQSRVTEGFLALFGARPQLGRLLSPQDFAAADVVVLDAGAWRRIWGGDPAVVGRTIRVDGEPLTVAGVLEDAFTPPEALVGRRVDVWRPLDWTSDRMTQHDASVLNVGGRLAASADASAAQAEVDALNVRMMEVHENYVRRDGSPREVPVLGLGEMTVQRVRTGLGLLMGAVSLLLLVACANVANLFLARGLGRTREMAVRRALGAGTPAIVGQLLVESLVVGLGGGVLGTGLAWLGIRAFVTLNPSALPRQAAVAMDTQVLLFAVAVSVATSVLFGLLPALRSVRHELADELRASGRTSTSGRGVALVRSVLVGGEIALSLMLVAGAGLLLRSFMTVRAQTPGFATEDIWTVPLNLPEPDSPAEYLQTMETVMAEVGRVPGVRSAAFGLTLPLQWTGGSTCCWSSRLRVPGREGDDDLGAMIHPVSVDYLETLGMELISGRAWGEAETTSEPVPVVVTESMARTLAGSPEAVLGSRFGLGPLDEAMVIGVVHDNRHYGLDQSQDDRRIRQQLYLPVERVPFPIPVASVVVHVEPDASRSMPRALREAVWRAVPSLPVTVVESMEERLAASTAGRRFDSMIFGTFAVMALLLAAGGLHGTLLYLAGQRKRELGIRLALGASRGTIEAQVLRSGLTLALVGVTLGLAGAWLTNRLLESRIWGVGRGDPVALGGAALLLLVTAAAASWWPARRAGRVDPLETLRME